MTTHEVKLSPEFKSQTTKAIISIVFFALSYLIIFIMSAALTVLCIYGGVMLIALRPTFITIALGIGLASLGILILVFLLKFIFKSHKTDRSHLHEISKDDEPELFRMIDEIVNKVGTTFPKRVYLSADVNASVFYDSNFWSMIFPIKKNLQIGLGLINTVSKSELKAILSHEFGHFSQKTMKVGSYVYNVNQIIFNLLYDNDSYDRIIQGWASVSGYFSIFVVLAVKIISFIQWILRGLYEIVNKAHMALSREMEFHADEIAAAVTGYEPLKTSLLRMELADFSFNSVLSFYESKITENQSSANIYNEQAFVMNFLAEESELPVKNQLPEVNIAELNKFNKSKLIMEDQWASHPSTEERIKKLEMTGLNSKSIDHTLANDLFSDINKRQQSLTESLFKEVKYEGEVSYIDLGSFESMYRSQYNQGTFPDCYNGYYDTKNIILFDLDGVSVVNSNSSMETLFSADKVDLVMTAHALQNDIETLKQIAAKTIPVKTFDYDGRKYKRKETYALISKLNTELEQWNDKIKQNDEAIYSYFRSEEKMQNKPDLLSEMYQRFFEFDSIFDDRNKVYIDLMERLQFINFTTPFDQIKLNFMNIKPLEAKLKEEIKNILDDQKFKDELTKDIKENFDLYLSTDWNYFVNDAYLEANLEMLFTTLNNYTYLLSKGYFLLKKELLIYQEGLTKEKL